MIALTLAQAAGTGDDTAIVVAVIGAVGAVLGALVLVLGQRSVSRLDGIDRRLEGIERRVDEGLTRLTDRIDRLFGPPPPTSPEPPDIATLKAALDQLRRAIERPSETSLRGEREEQR